MLTNNPVVQKYIDAKKNKAFYEKNKSQIIAYETAMKGIENSKH